MEKRGKISIVSEPTSVNVLKLAKDKYKTAAPLNAKRITMKQVNDAIQKVYPTVFLVKDKNYFFIASDDHDMGMRIAGLYQSSIPVYRLNELTIERWVEEVKALLEAKQRY